jgi:hypothetical protein
MKNLYQYLILLLVIINVVISIYIYINKDKNTRDNFVNSKSNYSTTYSPTVCTNDLLNNENSQSNPSPMWKSGNYNRSIIFPFAEEKIDGKCYCRPGFTRVDDPTTVSGYACVDSDGFMDDAVYNIANANKTNPSNIYGRTDNKEGSDCLIDTDCGQIRLNDDYSLEYLSDMRCSAPTHEENRVPGKCDNKSDIYKG